MKPTMESLLKLAYANGRNGFTSEEFDRLIALIEDVTIDTFEELAKYGVEE